MPESAGWVPSPAARPLVDRVDLDDIDVLSELTHEVRGAVLRRLKDPKSVAELAAQMDVPVTRLYHHVNRLLEHDLIQVVATRQVGAVTEKQYQVLGHTYGFDQKKMNDLDPRELAVALGGLFDVGKMGFQRMVEATGAANLDEADQGAALSLAERSVSLDRYRELLRQLTQVVEDFSSDLADDDDDAIRVTLLVAAYPEAR